MAAMYRTDDDIKIQQLIVITSSIGRCWVTIVTIV